MQFKNHFLSHHQNQQTPLSGFEIPFPSTPTNWPHNLLNHYKIPSLHFLINQNKVYLANFGNQQKLI